MTTTELADAIEAERSIVMTTAARAEIAGVLRQLQAENEALRKAAERAADALGVLWHDYCMTLAGLPVRNADEALSEATLAIAEARKAIGK
jgi:hypothetical protein